MSKKLTADDARQSLTAHVAAKGEELRAKYGPGIGWNELLRILEDRSACRYPCEVIFDAGPLQSGEFAFPVAKGAHPEDGFTLCVHPRFEPQADRAVYLVLYQLVQVNYGEFVSAADAETFGAAVLGISNEEYYQILCEMADEIAPAQSEMPDESRPEGIYEDSIGGGCGGTGCNCQHNHD